MTDILEHAYSIVKKNLDKYTDWELEILKQGIQNKLQERDYYRGNGFKLDLTDSVIYPGTHYKKHEDDE